MSFNGRSAALVLAVGLALVAPLPFGGTPPLAVILLALAVAAGLALLWSDRAGLARPPVAFAWLIALTGGWIAFQFVPLPPAAVDLLSPRLAAEARASLARSDEDPTLAAGERELCAVAGGERDESNWHPLVADPDGGLDGALRLALAFGAFCLGLLAVRDGRDRRLLMAAIGTSAFLQAVYGLAESLSGHHHIFTWAKQHYRPLASGTFICPNHFAALLSLGLFALLGLLIEVLLARPDAGDRRAKTSLAATVAGVILIGMIWSSSRAALAAASVGAVLLFILLRPRRGTGGGLGWIGIAAGVALIAALVAGAAWIRPPEPLANDVENISVDMGGRVGIWGTAVAVVEDFWRSGSGIGTFRYLHPLYRRAESNTRFVHAHNDYLEWISDTGLPGALLLAAWMAALGLAAWRILRSGGSERLLSVAMVAGLVALALHEVVDFSLQLPGVAIPAALLAGALLAPAAWGPGRPAGSGPAAWPRVVLVLALVIVTLTGLRLVGLRPLPVRPDSAPAQPVAAEPARRWARQQIDRVLRQAAARNRGAGDEQQARQALSAAWLTLQRAARRAPLRGDLRITQWLAVQSLAALDASRLASHPEVGQLLEYYLDRAVELAPADRQRRLVLARKWMLAGRPDKARRVVRGLLEMRPSMATEAWEILGGARLSLSDLMQATPNTPEAAAQLARFLLTAKKDPMGARIVLSRALERHPEAWQLRVALAQRQSAARHNERALEILDQRPLPEDPRWRRAALRTRIQALAALGRVGELREAIDALESGGEARSWLDYYRALGHVRQGEKEQAISLLERATSAQKDPLPELTRLRALILLGQLERGRGEYRKALDAYRRARKIDPSHPEVERFFAELSSRQ